MEAWLRETVLNATPEAFGYETVLWTREILAQLLKESFGVDVSGRTVSLHLRKLGLSYQKPRYRAKEQNAEEVAFFLNEKFPRIQRLAEKLGAKIAFEDEAGVGLRTHSGRTWGLEGHTPEVLVTDQRGGYNVLSIVTAEGELRYSLAEHTIQSSRYIEFLKQLIRGQQRPLILIADRVSFHGSRAVRDFVRAHRHQLRVFFLPRHSPELNPDEQVWHEIKDNRIGKQPMKNKVDLKKRLRSTLASLQWDTKRIISFFHLPDTEYAAS
jgi:transposase